MDKWKGNKPVLWTYEIMKIHKNGQEKDGRYEQEQMEVVY